MNLSIIAWPHDTSPIKEAVRSMYFVQIMNANTKEWNVIASVDESGAAHPIPFPGKDAMNTVLKSVRQSNPMLRVGWARFVLKNEGE